MNSRHLFDRVLTAGEHGEPGFSIMGGTGRGGSTDQRPTVAAVPQS